MKEKLEKGQMSKRTIKILLAICSIILIMLIVFSALLFVQGKKLRDMEGVGDGYICLTEGFTTVKVDDEETALQAINTIGKIIGIVNPKEELQVVSVYTVEDDTYYKIQQYHDSVPIEGNMITLAVDSEGNATGLTANTENYKKPEKETQRNEEEYIEKAIKSIEYKKLLKKILCDKVYVPDEQHSIVLSYPVKLTYLYKDEIHTEILYISSKDLSVLKKVDLGTSDVVLPNMSDVQKTLEEEQAGDLLVDKERNILCGYVSGKGDAVKDYLSSTSDAESVSAYENAQKIYDYFSSALGIQSFDNKGSGIYLMLSKDGYLLDKTASSNFEMSDGSVNCGAIILGEPDKVFTQRPVEAIDLIAHEYAQQIVRNIVTLENASIEEAICDVFGQFAELQVAEETSWQIGEKSGYAKYDMSKKVTMEDYDSKSERHENAAILAHVAYLMHEGIDGNDDMRIEAEKLVKLWYRSLFLLQADATYSQFRNAMELSACAMVNSSEMSEAEYKCVKEAFDQVLIQSASYTNANTMQNQFTLYIYDENKEEIGFDLTIYKVANLDASKEANLNPKRVYNQKDHYGKVKLELEDGVYELFIKGGTNDKTIEDKNIKIVVDSSDENANNELYIYPNVADMISENSNAQSQDTLSNYASVIAQYKTMLQVGYYKDNDGIYNMEGKGEYVSELLILHASYAEEFKTYYALTDINDDGISELIIGAKDPMYGMNEYDIFTHNGKEPVPLLPVGECGERTYFTIYDTGIISVNKTAGANYSGINYYELPSGETVLQMKEGLAYIEDGYFRLDENENAIAEINRSEFDEIKQQYSTKEKELDWVEITLESVGGEKPLALAKDMLQRLYNYEHKGCVCDLAEYSQLSLEEEEGAYNALNPSEREKTFSGAARKSLCCKTYEEAQKHIARYVDTSIEGASWEIHVEYANALYFYEPEIGFRYYEDVVVVECDKNKISAVANVLGSGGNLCDIVRIEMEKTKEGNYKIVSIREHTFEDWP